MSDWRQAVEEERDVLEKIADADLPISEDVAKLLEKADGEDV